ncbi:hypothetical protein D3C78_1869300 [compost metagenome]
MGADHMQVALGQVGDLVAVVDDVLVQQAMRLVVIADIHCSEDHPASPWPLSLDHQHRARAQAQ